MVEAASSEEYDGLYIFNNIKAAGFVVVAADDRVTPILGYSNRQQADDAVPSTVDAWLRDYSDAVLYCVDNAIVATDEISAQWRRLRENAPLDDPDEPHNAVAALLSTTWNQSSLYNSLCPYDSTAGEYTVTGCVATAMAQVMKYWERPVVGRSSHSYTHSTYGRLSADFAATCYAWSQMPNALTASSSQAQITAVATLMYHCGVAVRMNYGISANGGSNAQTIAYNNSTAVCAENALKNYFDYKSTLRGYERSNFTDGAWTAMVAGELDAGRPVIYTGRDPLGGHAFVCDGYDSRNHFHMNWGWGGSYDGYYALNALNPGGGGAGGNATYTFNSSQTMIIGIEPNSSALRVTPSQLTLSGLGATDSVYVRSSNTSSSGWTASCSAEWLTASPLSGAGSGQQTLMHISAPQNTTEYPRTARVVITQGTATDTLVVYQPSGSTSPTGWYGQTGGNMYRTFHAGQEFIVRPEAIGNFPVGTVLSQVRFSTCEAQGCTNNNFTIKVYEGSSLNAEFLSRGYTSQVGACLGTLVRSQQYTQSACGEQTVPLALPYVVGSRPFWVAVETAGPSAILFERRIVNCTVSVNAIPYLDSLDARYLYTDTSGGVNFLVVSYGAFYTDNEQTMAQEYNRDYALSFYTTAPPSCAAPSSPALVSVTNTAAVIGWSAGGDETSWVLHTFTLGGSHRYDTVTANPAVITRLLSGTTYSVAVAALCAANEVSGWSDTLSFTTPLCDAPTPSAALANGNTVTFSWTSPASVELWETEYGPRGFAHGQGTVVVANSPAATIAGLEPGNVYDFYVRSQCHDDVFSEWSEPLTVTIGSCGLTDCDMASGIAVTIHPNPASRHTGAVVAIESRGGAQQVEITVADIMGRIVWHQKIPCHGNHRQHLPLSGLSSGSYFVRVASQNFSETLRLVVQI